MRLSLREHKLALIAFGLLAFVSTIYVADEIYNDAIRLSNTVSRALFTKAQIRKARRRFKTKLVWLMGYPFSGTGVTMNLVETSAERSMATTYGDELMEKDEIAKKKYKSRTIQNILYPDGPFVHNMGYTFSPLPEMLLLTHCGGMCLDNHPDHECTTKEFSDPLYSLPVYQNGCLSGYNFDPDKVGANGKKGLRRKTRPINEKGILKAVLMIRNPMDVVASRFRDDVKDEPYYIRGLFNKRGLHEWCRAFDQRNHEKMVFNWHANREVTRLAMQIPCYVEYMRIAKWYNMASRTLTRRRDGHLLLYYEDYGKHKDVIINRLFDYLRLTMRNENTLFLETDRYEWYNQTEADKVAEYMWHLLGNEAQTYFAPYFGRIFDLKNKAEGKKTS